MTMGASCPSGRRRLAAALAACSLLLVGSGALAGEAGAGWLVVGGDARRGADLTRAFGCGGCHSIPGMAGATGNVGPSLDRFGTRTYIAGMLANTPPNLIHWLRDPQGVVPGNAMPDMRITEAQARDIAAYLYTLR